MGPGLTGGCLSCVAYKFLRCPQAESSGHRTYGMRFTDAPGRPEPDPDTAPTVNTILDRVLRGDSLTRIARDLNRDGHRPRRGLAWTHTGIAPSDRLAGP